MKKYFIIAGEPSGDLYGGKEQFLALYHAGTPNRYDFIHLDLQENPPIMYSNFDKIIAKGSSPQIQLNKNMSFEEKNIDNM